MNMHVLEKLLSRVATVGFILLLAVAVYVGVRMVENRVRGDIYQAHLVELDRTYHELLEQYNDAVRRTAVTELLVEEDTIVVKIRTAAGVAESIDTGLDPQREIYVDYVVVDGRLWIRRLYDDETAPRQGVVVDPSFAEIDWNAPNVGHGKAAYRQLDAGRWVVTVSGNGALELKAVDMQEQVALSEPPHIESYEEIESEVRRRVGELGMTDVLRHMLGGG